MSEPFIGEIVLFAGNYAPRGWALCNGQMLPIQQYNALFSVLSTTYGGDGITKFAIPDLRGRVPVHAGMSQGAGLPEVELGDAGGSSTVTLMTANMPAHVHTNTALQISVPVSIPVVTDAGDSSTPGSGKVLAQAVETVVGGAVNIYGNGSSITTLKPFNADATVQVPSTGISGVGAPISVQNPFLGLNYIIAVEGIYPSRS
jgi:microcystin-dependent protein